MAQAASKTFGKEVSPKQLSDMMAKGQVDSKVLIEFGKILQEQARVGGQLEVAMKTTSAQQARFNNAFSDWVMKLSASGFDKGMATLFDSMATMLEASNPFVEKFGAAFKGIAEDIQDIVYFFSGKESTFGKMDDYWIVSLVSKLAEGVSSVISMKTAMEAIGVIITGRAFMAALSLMAIPALPLAAITAAGVGGLYIGNKVQEASTQDWLDRRKLELPDGMQERLQSALAEEKRRQEWSMFSPKSSSVSGQPSQIDARATYNITTNKPEEITKAIDEHLGMVFSKTDVQVPFRAR